MRARELFENYNQDLESDLDNMLVAAKGSGAFEIKTQDVVDQLYSMGYSVNINNIIPLLSKNPIVLNVTSQLIKLTEPEGAYSKNTDAQDSANRVSDMAQQATKKEK